MKKIFLLAILLISLTAFVSCSQSNEPKPPEHKDPREMTWTADTLNYPGALQTLMGSIWASSPNDVHVVGYCDESEGSYWHFNGNEWECINLFNYIDRGALSLQKVWGFAANDFWIVGEIGIFEDESLILHYDANGIIIQP